jgi:predicted PurR-regulated permease PerM
MMEAMEAPLETRSRLPFGLSWEKVVIWTLFGATVYSLRHFFDIVFMTFLISYVAQRMVRFVGRGRWDHWSRRPTIVVLYLAAFAGVYFTGQFTLPRAIEQGKNLLGQVQNLNLDRIRDEVLSNTLGRIELVRYKRTPEYTQELAEFVRKKSSLPSRGDFQRLAAQLRQSFRDDLVLQEGRHAIEDLKVGAHFFELYRDWVKDNRAGTELAAQPKLRQELEQKFDDSWRNIYGAESFEQEKTTPKYQEQRQATVLRGAADRLAAEGRWREEAELAIGRKLGADRVAAMAQDELERRFQDYYTAEAQRRPSVLAFPYVRFVALEQAATDPDFQAALGAEAQTTLSPEEEFDQALQLKLGKAHPWAELLGDSSQLVRTNMPKITTWLTEVINNVIGFLLNALLSLMFSAMIVWEVPRMRRSIGRVHGTRAEPVFNEIAPGVQRLGIVIGTAFSAQMIIACLNSAFAFVAITFLGLPSPLFLSLLVLFFSLVPYVGIVIATVPILIVALQDGGAHLGLYTAIAMLVIHEMEAWILGPKILGDILHLNPIAVILVLFVGQQLFGVWGLLLAVPVSVFLINDVFLQPASSTLKLVGEAPRQEEA